jgi:hypothetical protein
MPMARIAAKKDVAKAESLDLATGSESVPRIPFSETGAVGLRQINGQIIEESRRELVYPQAAKTFKTMSMDATIASGLNLFQMMMSRVKWNVHVPNDATDLVKKQAKFLAQVQDDMEHSWYSFIKEAVSFYTYGFAPHEIVLRKRLKVNGSKYDDGLVGVRKLPIRSQDTITKVEFSEDGREFLGLHQNPQGILDFYGGFNGGKATSMDEVFLRKNKLLIFTCDSTRGNPLGTSPLLKCYYAWKYRTKIEEHEAVSLSRDLNGIPRFKIPSEYLSEGASDEKKAAAEAYMKIGRNIQANEQASVVVPSDRDDKGNLIFEFDLVSSSGSNRFDTNAIISRYNSAILQALWADILQMGQSSVGSYSLSDTKNSLVIMAVEDKLMGMQETLKQLRDLLFKMNGWSLEGDLPYWEYEEVEQSDLDVLSKAVQRYAATGAIELDRDVLNITRQSIGAKPHDADKEPMAEYLPEKTSNSGEGMSEGLNSGTGSASGSSGDSSTGNTENKSLHKSLSDDFESVYINGRTFNFMKQDAEEFK